MAMLQLDPLIPVLVKHKDAWVKAMVHVMIDYGFEHDLMFVCFADESRECWTVANKNIRAQDTITAGRFPLKLEASTHTHLPT
jgi:hypothetical protein